MAIHAKATQKTQKNTSDILNIVSAPLNQYDLAPVQS